MRTRAVFPSLLASLLLASCLGAGDWRIHPAIPNPALLARAAGIAHTARDGSEIRYPPGFQPLDPERDRIADAARDLPEPSRAILSRFGDRASFVAVRDGDLLLVVPRDAVPRSEDASWREEETRALLQEISEVESDVRGSDPGARIKIGSPRWDSREGAVAVLIIPFAFESAVRVAEGWAGAVFTAHHAHRIWAVGEERDFRLLLERSRFAGATGRTARSKGKTSILRRPLRVDGNQNHAKSLPCARWAGSLFRRYP